MLSLAEIEPNARSFCHLTRPSCAKTWMKWNDKRSILLLVASSDSEVFANDLTVLSFVSRRKEGRREGTIPLLLFFVFRNFATRSLDAYFTTFPQEQFEIETNKTTANCIAGDGKHFQASPYQQTTSYGHAAVQRFPRAFQRRTQGRGRKGEREHGGKRMERKGIFRVVLQPVTRVLMNEPKLRASPHGSWLRCAD